MTVAEATSASTDERTPLLLPSPAATAPSPADATHSISLKRKWIIMAGCTTAAAFVTLDTTIMAALITPIAASFHASHEQSWLGTSYLLANIVFTPGYGRFSEIFGRRVAAVSAISLFTLGTLGCAVAPTFKWFILARFVAGAGGGGIVTTRSIVMSDLFELKQRGLVAAITTMTGAVGGSLGGPLGGVVSDKWGWRSAFIFQIPLLVPCILACYLNIDYHVSSFQHSQSLRTRLARVDFAGSGSLFVAFGAGLTALSLRKNELLPWTDPWVILATVLAPLFLGVFLYVEAKVSLEPILPYALLARRTPAFVCLVTISVAVCNWGIMYHYPLFFLSLLSSSASTAGGHLLPSSFGFVLGGLSAGIVLHRTGKYRIPNAIFGFFPVLATVTITSLHPGSPSWLQWVANAPLGYGFGYILNSCFVALMASVPQSDMPAVTGLMWLFRTTGQVVGVALTSAILQGVLTPQLVSRITGPDAAKIIQDIRSNAAIIPTLPLALQQAAKASYAVALRWTFSFCALFAALAWLSVLFIPQLSLEAKKVPDNVVEEYEEAVEA